MTSKKRQKIPKIKNLPPQQAQVEMAPKGIQNTDELVAPTPRRDPIECALEDARDYIALNPPDGDTETHELIGRLADILRVTADLLADYRDERDTARHVIETLRAKRYRITNGIGVYR